MSRSLIRVTRIFAVILLVAGLGTGVYVGVTRQAQQDAAVKTTPPDDRGLSDIGRVSRDASRAARDHKLRSEAEDRARDKAARAGREAADRAAAADDAATEKEQPKPEPPSYGPVPASCKEYSGNREIGCALLLEWNFSLDQMPCLNQLWTTESGWNERASNPSSGAYGIPQALPGSKMSSHGDDWRTNPATQIKWGLDYIKGRYNDPCGAWEHHQANNWY
ncbi:MAG: transglycosylase SLT domain-containing protein [Micromonosporaceae bacterium]